MPNHEYIYRSEAARYDELISKQPCLLEAIRAVKDPKGLDIIDVGAGTGRLTLPLAREARSLLALDASDAMLEVTREKLKRAGLSHCRTAVSDHRSLAAESCSAELVVAGWSICYTASSLVAAWESKLDSVIRELRRVLRPGGTLILFETLGTGTAAPSPPKELTGYYRLLEGRYGFERRVLRTDYSFSDAEEAQRLTAFFFGEELSQRIAREELIRVPEYAGMWWRSY